MILLMSSITERYMYIDFGVETEPHLHVPSRPAIERACAKKAGEAGKAREDRV